MVKQRLHVDPLRVVLHSRHEPVIIAQNVEYENVADLIGGGIGPPDLL
jgi:hypothetical protein